MNTQLIHSYILTKFPARIFIFFVIFSTAIVKIVSTFSMSAELIYIIIVIIFTFLLVIFWPKYFIYIAILLWPFRGLIDTDARFAIDSGSVLSFDLNGLINVLIIFAGIIYLLVNYKTPFSNSIAVAYTVFLVFCILSLIYSQYFYGGIRFVARISSPFLFYLIIFNEIKSYKDNLKLINCILVSGIFPIVVGLKQLIYGQGNTETEGIIRIYGVFEHPNAFSFFLVLFFCISYTVLLTNKSRWKIILLFLLNALIAVLLIETYCRISWIAFFAIFLLISFRYRRRWIIIIPIIFTTLLYALFSSDILERLISAISIFSSNSPMRNILGYGSYSSITEKNFLYTGNSLGWRFNAWFYLFGQIRGHLLIGHGVGSVYSAINDLYNVYIHPHNVFVGILYDTGITGLSLFIIFIIFLFKSSTILAYKIAKENKNYDYVTMFLACTLSFIIIATSDNIFENPIASIYFWIFCAIGGLIYKSYSRIKDAKY